MTNITNIGVIGAGMMTQVGHLPFLANDPRCRIKAVAESRPSIINYIKEHYPELIVVEDYHAILENKEIDAVILSAPRPATGPITLECLKAGKHILAEKPMAHSAVQAKTLVDAASEQELIYAVGFMKRYDPGIFQAQKLFQEYKQSGEIGSFLFARFYNHAKSYAFPVPPHQRPQESRITRFDTWALCPDWLPETAQGSYAWFMNSASHDVNLINYFFENNASVITAAISPNDSVSATLQASGCLVSLDVTRTEAGQWLEGAEFCFEKGRICIEVPSPMNVEGVSRITIHTNDGEAKQFNPDVGKGWSFELQVRGFLSALNGEELPRTSGLDGLRDMELIEDIWKTGLGC